MMKLQKTVYMNHEFCASRTLYLNHELSPLGAMNRVRAPNYDDVTYENDRIHELCASRTLYMSHELLPVGAK